MARINYKDHGTAKTLIREFNENAKIQNNLNHRVHNLHHDLNRCIQTVFKDMNLHFHYGSSKTVIIGIPRGKSLSDNEIEKLEELFNIKYVEYLGEFHHDEGTFIDLLFHIMNIKENEDKVFDYLSHEENRLNAMYKERKEYLQNLIKDNNWDKALLELSTCKSLQNQLLHLEYMIESHECGDL